MQARPSEPPSRDQPLNPIINPCTDPRLGRIWPLPDSTFLPLQSAFVPILTPSFIYFFAPPPLKKIKIKKKSQSRPDDAAFQLHGGGSGADWGHLQAGVKQIRTSAKWISWLPLWTGGMCWVSPVPSCLGFRQMGAHVTDTAAVAEWHYLSSQQPPALSWGKINWHVHSITLHSGNTL